MNVVLKRVSLALALLIICTVILAATKSYGIRVISGFAVFFFILGLLRKEKAPEKADELEDDKGEKSGQVEGP